MLNLQTSIDTYREVTREFPYAGYRITLITFRGVTVETEKDTRRSKIQRLPKLSVTVGNLSVTDVVSSGG